MSDEEAIGEANREILRSDDRARLCVGVDEEGRLLILAPDRAGRERGANGGHLVVDGLAREVRILSPALVARLCSAMA